MRTVVFEDRWENTGQYLVTIYDDEAGGKGRVELAHRAETWDVWGIPMALVVDEGTVRRAELNAIIESEGGIPELLTFEDRAEAQRAWDQAVARHLDRELCSGAPPCSGTECRRVGEHELDELCDSDYVWALDGDYELRWA